MRTLAAMLLLALPAAAQEAPLTPPPPPPVEAAAQEAPLTPPPPPPVEAAAREPSDAERCFSVPAQVFVAPQPMFHAQLPASGTTPTGGSGRATPGFSGGGSAQGSLVLAVVLAAALPVAIYVLDGEAEPIVRQRFFCPSFSFEGGAGGETGTHQPGFTPVATGRFTFGYAYGGGDFQFDYGSPSSSALAAHALIRIQPRQHVEGAVALGYRRAVLGGAVREGVELGLPHRYALFRDGLRTVGLDVRPMLSLGTRGLDAGLEVMLVVPIAEVLHLRGGGRVDSFGAEVLWGFSGGLNLTI